jgi:hypothetical protein
LAARRNGVLRRQGTRNEVNLKATKKPVAQAALLGLGLDRDDGQIRLTKGKNFVLYGGSAETHSTMQETVIKLNEQLDQRGKRLEDVPPRELRDMISEIRA